MLAITALYFVSYLLFSFLTKSVGGGVLLLPASTLCCTVVMALTLSIQHLVTAIRRRWPGHPDDVVAAQLREDGVAVIGRIQAPPKSFYERIRPRLFSRDVFIVSGASAIILFASTAAYSTPDVSLLVPLLLMKGGVLLWGPFVDWLHGEGVTVRARLILGLAVIAVAGALWHKISVSTSIGVSLALGCAVAYVTAYFPKLHVIARYRGDLDFLVADLVTTLLIALPGSIALAVVMVTWRQGWTLHTLQSASHAFLGLVQARCVWLLSVASEGCALFGGLIFFARLESTLTVPLNRCTSLLAGFVATLLLWAGRGDFVTMLGRVGDYFVAPTNRPEVVGVVAMLVALWLGTRRSSGRSEVVSGEITSS